MTLVNFMLSMPGRLIRVALGVALIVIGLAVIGGAAGIVLAVVGLVPIAAGVANFCLIGPVFGADFWGRPRGTSGTSTGPKAA